MCGRYALATDVAQLVREFDAGVGVVEQLAPDYNIAPSKSACIVRLDDEGRRILDLATWGLIPSWSKEAAIAHRLTNARSETAAQKPSFRSALAKRRCIVPALGYYEWYRPSKQPFYIHAAGGGLLAMAGLSESWRDPAHPEAPARRTFTILTREPRAEIAMIHDRMPVMIPRDRVGEWLDPSTPAERVAQMMDPVGPVQGSVDPLDAYPVATTVNAVRNNGPELITPIDADLSGATSTDEADGLW